MRYSTFLVAFALIQGAFGQAAANGTRFVLEADVLKHFEGFNVLVERPSDDAKSIGATEERIKTAVELRLRSLGLPVNGSLPVPYLYVNVGVRCLAGGVMCAVHIYVSVLQVVSLPGNAQTLADIWSTKALIIAGRDALSDKLIEGPLLGQVDRFANAYLSVHPKKQ